MAWAEDDNLWNVRRTHQDPQMVMWRVSEPGALSHGRTVTSSHNPMKRASPAFYHRALSLQPAARSMIMRRDARLGGRNAAD